MLTVSPTASWDRRSSGFDRLTGTDSSVEQPLSIKPAATIQPRFLLFMSRDYGGTNLNASQTRSGLAPGRRRHTHRVVFVANAVDGYQAAQDGRLDFLVHGGGEIREPVHGDGAGARPGRAMRHQEHVVLAGFAGGEPERQVELAG